jgi:two-component system response regulator MprA
MILDLGLPDIDGKDVIRHLREWSEAPIIVLSAREQESEKVAALDAGADDYVNKPVSIDELMARLRALLRRGATSADERPYEVLSFDDIQVDLGTRIATRGPRELRLTPREFDLLVYFLRNPNFVLTRAQIMQRVWGDDFWGDSNVLEVFVANLRKTLEADSETRVIQTVRGVGYVLRKSPA